MSLTDLEVRDSLIEAMITVNSISQREYGGHADLDQASEAIERVLNADWPDWASADRPHA